ncbi:MAG: hypothetical protein KGZ40_05690 [Clostridiales bacterium]|nr:hypothetical protein [Clostridiales bacterium]
MSALSDKIQKFMDDIASDAIEERVVDYVIKEVQNGRSLSEVFKDPYVKNRLSEEKLAKVLENPEIIGALESQIAASFKRRELDF